MKICKFKPKYHTEHYTPEERSKEVLGYNI